MPIYEYQCPKCGKFDAIQKMSDKPLKTHDVCGSKVKRLLSASSFSFKGTGFYITDYKKTNGSGATSEKKADSSSSATEVAKTKSESTSSAPSQGKGASGDSSSPKSKEKAA